MKTVAFVTQKGGAGKTTLAACLAVAAQEQGERVFMLDMDPQGSLTSWAESREGEDPRVDTVAPAKLPEALTALKTNKFTLVIIDTAGSDTPAVSAAMKAADLCLIPSRPTAFDLKASMVTRDAIKTLGREYAFVLNQCQPGPHTSRANDGAAALEMLGGLVRPLIISRVDYQQAAVTGRGVTEFAPSKPAAEEMRALWVSVKKRLGGKAHGAAKHVAA